MAEEVALERDDTVDKPKNEEQQVRRWHDRIATSLRWREDVERDKRWHEFEKEYKGSYDVHLGDIIVPPINEVFAYVQASLAGFLFKNPYITVNPKKNSSIKSAKIKEVAINYLWRELKVKEENETTAIDSLLIGHGWTKVGHSAQVEGKGDQLKLDSEEIFAHRVSWRDIVFNIGSKELGDHQWMAQRIIRPLEDIKDEYPNTQDLRGTFHPMLKKHDVERTMFKDDIMFGILWEIWDARSKMVYVVAEGQHKKYLKKSKWPEYLDEFPFVPLWFNKVPDEPYPLSDIGPWEPQILETIKIFTQILNHQKRWNRQLLIKKGAMTEAQKAKFSEAVDGSVIEHQTTDVRRDTMVTDYGSMNPDVYTILDRLDNIKRNVNGQPEIDRGAATRTQTRTLGELQLIKAGAKSRTDKKIDRIETHIENVSRQMIAHMKAHFDIPTVVKITGESPRNIVQAFQENFNPATGEITFTKEDITGEEDVEVKAGSTLPLDRQTRLQVLDGILKNIGPIIAQGATASPFLQAIVSEMLADFDIKTLEFAFSKEVQALAQKTQQAQRTRGIENAKTVAEAEKRKSQADQIDAETMQIKSESRMQIDPTLQQALNQGGNGQQ